MIRKIASQRCILPIVCCLFITVGVSTKSLAQLPGAAGDVLSLLGFFSQIGGLTNCTTKAEYAFGTDDQGKENRQKFNANLYTLYSLAEHCTFPSETERKLAVNLQAMITVYKNEAENLYFAHFNPNKWPISVGCVKFASCMTVGFATPVLNDFCKKVEAMYERIFLLKELLKAHKCIGVP
jgi:hypothetical protein